jgi:DNA-binding MarR family transcriptional regulator
LVDPRSDATAERLHSVAVRMLRMVRREDRASGLSGPRLSALSVLVFGGPLSLAGLAAAEQVSAPTMTRIVDGLVRAGLATRTPEPENRRQVRIDATDEGRRILEEGRRRRVRVVADRLGRLADSERRAVERAVELLERALR